MGGLGRDGADFFVVFNFLKARNLICNLRFHRLLIISVIWGALGEMLKTVLSLDFSKAKKTYM